MQRGHVSSVQRHVGRGNKDGLPQSPMSAQEAVRQLFIQSVLPGSPKSYVQGGLCTTCEDTSAEAASRDMLAGGTSTGFLNPPDVGPGGGLPAVHCKAVRLGCPQYDVPMKQVPIEQVDDRSSPEACTRLSTAIHALNVWGPDVGRALGRSERMRGGGAPSWKQPWWRQACRLWLSLRRLVSCAETRQ